MMITPFAYIYCETDFCNGTSSYMQNCMQLLIGTEKFNSHVTLEAHENTYICFKFVQHIACFAEVIYFFFLLYCFKSLAFLSSLATSLDRNRRWQRTQNQFKTLTVSI